MLLYLMRLMPSLLRGMKEMREMGWRMRVIDGSRLAHGDSRVIRRSCGDD